MLPTMRDAQRRFGLRSSGLLWATLLLFVGLATGGCGGGAQGVRTNGSPTLRKVGVSFPITKDRYSRALYALMTIGAGEERALLQREMSAYLVKKGERALTDGRMDEAFSSFEELMGLYGVNELPGALPVAAVPFVRRLERTVSRRGNEAKALSTLWFIKEVARDDKAKREYSRVATWGVTAREAIADNMERAEGLLAVWEEHARHVPAKDVVERVSSMHIQLRRDTSALLEGELKLDGNTPAEQLSESVGQYRVAAQMSRRAMFGLVGLRLANGDMAGAMRALDGFDTGRRDEKAMAELLKQGVKGDVRAWLTLAAAYRESLPHVTRGLCERGLARFGREPRFALCLAQWSAQSERLSLTAHWVLHAVNLAPDRPEIYDDSLRALRALISAQLFDSDPWVARSLVDTADVLLARRLKRWPNQSPAIAPEQFNYIVGVFEMNVGQPAAAEKRFRQSVAYQPSADAYLQLGRLLEGRGALDGAAEYFQKALKLEGVPSEKAWVVKAEAAERLGDVHRQRGQMAESKKYYEQALSIWENLQKQSPDAEKTGILVSQGLLEDRLGNADKALAYFQRAINATSAGRDVYARVLSHLVASSDDPEHVRFAVKVFNRARKQRPIKAEWKVYFALWVSGVAALTSKPTPDDVMDVLKAYVGDPSWWGKLAAFGMGRITEGELLEGAQNVGQRTEALFYDGLKKIRAGDDAKARQKFQAVLKTGMINFFEYTLAKELLARPWKAAPAAPNAGKAE